MIGCRQQLCLTNACIGSYDWVRLLDFSGSSRLFPGRGQVEDGGVPEVLAPYRKGRVTLNQNKNSWVILCQLTVSFPPLNRMPCPLCSGGNSTGVFRPPCRSVVAASVLALVMLEDEKKLQLLQALYFRMLQLRHVLIKVVPSCLSSVEAVWFFGVYSAVRLFIFDSSSCQFKWFRKVNHKSDFSFHPVIVCILQPHAYEDLLLE